MLGSKGLSPKPATGWNSAWRGDKSRFGYRLHLSSEVAYDSNGRAADRVGYPDDDPGRPHDLQEHSHHARGRFDFSERNGIANGERASRNPREGKQDHSHSESAGRAVRVDDPGHCGIVRVPGPDDGLDSAVESQLRRGNSWTVSPLG